jgi:hypothetical protein
MNRISLRMSALIVLSYASLAFGQATGVKLWIGEQPVCNECSGPLPLVFFRDVDPRWQPNALHPVRVEVATVPQLDAAFKALNETVQSQLKVTAVAEVETRLLDRIAVLERRVAELETARAKPAARKSQPQIVPKK